MLQMGINGLRIFEPSKAKSTLTHSIFILKTKSIVNPIKKVLNSEGARNEIKKIDGKY